MAGQIYNRTIDVDGVKTFYREAGDQDNPSLLLLPGFPTSSIMYKNLMTALSDSFHLVAPDYPGFGFSDFPAIDRFEYSFANIARHINRLCEEIHLRSFIIYLHDYGQAVGLALCVAHPEKIMGIIIQNGNTYEEGVKGIWDEIREFWKNPTEEKKKMLYAFLSEEGVRDQYTAGVPKKLLPTISPELPVLDWLSMKRPGNLEMQFILNCDYKTHMGKFGAYQEYFRKNQPPTIILWGRYDPFFNFEEAHCYQRDLPGSTLHIVDGSHWILETNFEEVVSLIRGFLDKNYSHNYLSRELSIKQ